MQRGWYTEGPEAGTEAGISFGAVKRKKPKIRVSDPLSRMGRGAGGARAGADEAPPFAT